MCIYCVLKEYLTLTKVLRKNCDRSRLLISYVKPYKPVTRDTISRWIKCVLFRSGVDTKIFSSHSVRAAANSKAKINSIPIMDILQKAGWSREKTFARFYDKEIVHKDAVQNAILK